MSGAGPVRVVGDVMTDVVVRVDGPVVPAGDTPARIRVLAGGAGANVAHHLAAHGVPVALHAAVGDDAFGRDALRVLTAAGVDCRVRVDPARATGTCVILVDASGERTMLPDQGANAALDAPADPAGARHVHVSGYVLHAPATRAAGVAALRAAAAAGVPTSVDAASAAPLRAMGASVFLDAVRGVALLVVTGDEAEVLTGTRDARRAAGRLAGDVREVVVKLGREGALHLGQGGVSTAVPAAPPPGPVVDSTGAGDAFMAALLAARLAGAAPRGALEAAVAAGARAVTVPGARPRP